MTNVRSTFDTFKKYGDDGAWDFEKGQDYKLR